MLISCKTNVKFENNITTKSVSFILLIINKIYKKSNLCEDATRIFNAFLIVYSTCFALRASILSFFFVFLCCYLFFFKIFFLIKSTNLKERFVFFDEIIKVKKKIERDFIIIL